MLSKRSKKSAKEIKPPKLPSANSDLHLRRSTSRSKSKSKKQRTETLKRTDTTANTHKPRHSMDEKSAIRQLLELQASHSQLIEKHATTLKENRELMRECRELRSKYHDCQQSKVQDQIKVKSLIDESRNTQQIMEELSQCRTELLSTKERLLEETEARRNLQDEKMRWIELKARLLQEYAAMLQEVQNLKSELSEQ